MVPYPKEKQLEMLRNAHNRASEIKGVLFLTSAALVTNLAGIISSIVFQSKWMIIPVILPLAAAITKVFFSSMKRDERIHTEAKEAIERNEELVSLPGNVQRMALPEGRF